MLQCKLEIWVTWPGKRTKEPRKGQFSVTYPRLLDHLNDELDKLDARDIVLQLSLPGAQPSPCRAYDGWPKSDAKWINPGVILNFECCVGPVQFACDTYLHWQDNLRAIGLTLERLRDVERYGAVKGGQQYRGFAALPPAPTDDKAGGLSDRTAACILSQLAGGSVAETLLLADPGAFSRTFRSLSMKLHPDRGGNPHAFREMVAAADVLKRRHGL